MSSQEVFPPGANAVKKGPLISSMKQYKKMYERSLNDSDNFWAEMAKKQLSWYAPFTRVQQGGFKSGNVAWYLEGKLNACYNCVDRHLEKRGSQVALLWEGNDSKNIRKITYEDLLEGVCRIAGVLKDAGVKRGDCVCIYMPMVPEAAMTMLACARIGALHSVVFAGFSAEALADRIIDGGCKVVITADEGLRAKKKIALKAVVDKAVMECKEVETVLVYKHTGSKIPWHENTDKWLLDEMKKQRPYCPCAVMDSEDPLFMLYTSGSTGRPKGILHTTGGYMVWSSLTHKYVFDYQEGDVYACVADIGWITGHSYIVYGPLCNGGTSFMFESTPLFPDAGRYWDMVQRHKINSFYTAPTAIRALMKFGDDPVKKYDLSSLRVLGSVGEPINPEAWKWYYEIVGGKKCSIVDTYWQTETGGIMLTPLPGVTQTKPGSATFPFFGVEPVILSADTGERLDTKEGVEASGIVAIKRPWPGMCRTIKSDHERYFTTYLKPYASHYFTGDGGTKDKDGYFWITGRVDDVINVSGHRIGSAEVESALVEHEAVAESAVVGVDDPIKGQALFAYVTLTNAYENSIELVGALKQAVRSSIGGFARPDYILATDSLPKTRSGKIMRRLLRKIATKDKNLGDVSTLADPKVVDKLVQMRLEMDDARPSKVHKSAVESKIRHGAIQEAA
uniref:Acetyl-coenzyme A synthetase n=1 Tax=Amorphochlora amoebiformis TaxID=1561963 RepID=A0A7S0D9Y5_9EUKA|mmetsp:Transcript_2207/g.3131  ORF Transcript_2207/g.3131 Transcript_2207/m.3131 type:complete len:678 (+) Transcript_2207:36-2069(+)